MRFTTILSIICTFAFGISGQVKPRATSDNLKTVINQYAAKVVTDLNQSSKNIKYKVSGKNTFYSDVDGNGSFDAVVEMFFCEKSSCHPTTQSSKVAIFINRRGRYTFIDDKEFSLIGKINSVDGSKINISIYDLDEGDPQCCPEIKRHEVYDFKNGKLTKRK